MTADVERRVVGNLRLVLSGTRTKGIPTAASYCVGLMLTADGPKVVEFNVRLGDPETQVVLPMLDEELSWLLGEAAMGALPSRAARFLPGANVGVVLAAGGYPEAVETGQPISGLDAAAAVPDALVFHAGTSRREGQIVTSGGRVLTVVGRGRTTVLVKRRIELRRASAEVVPPASVKSSDSVMLDHHVRLSVIRQTRCDHATCARAAPSRRRHRTPSSSL